MKSVTVDWLILKVNFLVQHLQKDTTFDLGVKVVISHLTKVKISLTCVCKFYYILGRDRRGSPSCDISSCGSRGSVWRGRSSHIPHIGTLSCVRLISFHSKLFSRSTILLLHPFYSELPWREWRDSCQDHSWRLLLNQLISVSWPPAGSLEVR